jgi:hypothetical protein
MVLTVCPTEDKFGLAWFFKKQRVIAVRHPPTRQRAKALQLAKTRRLANQHLQTTPKYQTTTNPTARYRHPTSSHPSKPRKLSQQGGHAKALWSNGLVGPTPHHLVVWPRPHKTIAPPGLCRVYLAAIICDQQSEVRASRACSSKPIAAQDPVSISRFAKSFTTSYPT